MQEPHFGLALASLCAAVCLPACGGSEFGSDGAPVVVADAGSGGAPASGGSGGTVSATGGAGGTASGGGAGAGATSSGGRDGGGGPDSGLGGRASNDAGSDSGAAGAVTTQDAGSGVADAGSACSDPVTFFPDGDGDGYGRSTGTTSGCLPPPNGKWAKVGGDCDDDNADVHPGQTDFFGEARSTSGGTHSFDYDCSNAEEGDPSQLGAAPNCGILSIVGCSGVGYAASGRTGSGVNVLCGSTVQVTCKSSGFACTTVKSDVSVPYRCR
ncbi:MAG TPA: hypothetical protein VHE30_20215 [Polyangiaceae bacterium]|nr:hypothetical protein [Polyangiaceae bacterium]